MFLLWTVIIVRANISIVIFDFLVCSFFGQLLVLHFDSAAHCFVDFLVPKCMYVCVRKIKDRKREINKNTEEATTCMKCVEVKMSKYKMLCILYINVYWTLSGYWKCTLGLLAFTKNSEREKKKQQNTQAQSMKCAGYRFLFLFSLVFFIHHLYTFRCSKPLCVIFYVEILVAKINQMNYYLSLAPIIRVHSKVYHRYLLCTLV